MRRRIVAAHLGCAGGLDGGKHRIGGQAGAFGQPAAQQSHGTAGQRGDALFAALAVAADVLTRTGGFPQASQRHVTHMLVT
ncbi:hypothetical protein [Amycolatopsis coloradensis]|uniref:hypothetical protein n=1 Tax=Amycolatopsis coloradensis TaxID=76021 RepID=UPI0011788AE1|nr:hypothetical protein [Amycolatopsis coloradensis]